MTSTYLNSVYCDSKLLMMTPSPLLCPFILSPSLLSTSLLFSSLLTSPLHFSRPFTFLSDCCYKIAKLVVLLDKKAFIAEHKHNIIALLEERGVTWTHKTADVRVIWEQAMLSGATKWLAFQFCCDRRISTQTHMPLGWDAIYSVSLIWHQLGRKSLIVWHNAVYAVYAVHAVYEVHCVAVLNIATLRAGLYDILFARRLSHTTFLTRLPATHHKCGLCYYKWTYRALEVERLISDDMMTKNSLTGFHFVSYLKSCKRTYNNINFLQQKW